MGAQSQTIDSFEQKINSQESNSALIRGMSKEESQDAYLSITSPAVNAVAPNSTNLSWHARLQNLSSGFFS
ncbi:MAG: hypothetical protein EB053_03060 [Chlamydiae bacterium]|nr:hypothetical protein [Chlamydiota bacterium]